MLLLRVSRSSCSQVSFYIHPHNSSWLNPSVIFIPSSVMLLPLPRLHAVPDDLQQNVSVAVVV